ncbi:MAG: CoA transferase [Smithellaceae bacterium]|nr:CoA transferase [Syntrophaceae bacterium]MDD4241056.1 CoA transferase [Smithellaceae bacterium]NLX51309.1 CoA transferase [Deltaproteobacteria bacterium]
MSAKEAIYTRHGGKAGDRGKMLAEIMNAEGKPEVLDDVLVLDVSSANFAGIICASLLAEFGAEVIKIEPADGDPARQITPFGVMVQGVGVPFMFEGRNKRYLTLDVKNSEEDRKTFARLAAKAAVVIESFLPGEMDAWGIGYRQLSAANPGLVYVALSAYGQYTDKAKDSARMPDTDITSQAGSGLPAQMGAPPEDPEPLNWPLRGGMWAGWYISGLSAAFGATVALIHRQNTGEGQMVDVAGMDAYSSMVGMPATIGFTWEKARPRIGVLDFILYPYGHWKCKDGFVAIAAPRDHDFRALLKILGLWEQEDDWRYSSDRIPDILEQALHLHKIIEEKTVLYTADELVKMALNYSRKSARSKWRGGGVPIVMKLMTPEEAMSNKQWEVRKAFQEVEDEKLGKFIISANFVKMSESPPRVKWVSSEIGRDNDYVREKYLRD